MAQGSKAKGITQGLTNYGDNAFSAYMRRSFARSMGYSPDMLQKPVIGIADTRSGFNNCHRHFPELIEAIVLAVPMTAQVPAVVARLPSISRISSEPISPARNLAQKRRQSVQAPSRSPCQRDVSIGPATSWIAGRFADTAPIN